MVFTVNEAFSVLRVLRAVNSLSLEYGYFSARIGLLKFFFFILAVIRSVIVFTFIYALVNQEPDVMAVWNSGNGIGYLLLYIFASCLPLIGNLVVIFTPIYVIIQAFSLGDGFGSNLAIYLLPIAAAYLFVFSAVMITNSIMEAVTEKKCPNTYGVLKWINKYHGFDQPFNELDILRMECILTSAGPNDADIIEESLTEESLNQPFDFDFSKNKNDDDEDEL